MGSVFVSIVYLVAVFSFEVRGELCGKLLNNGLKNMMHGASLLA